MAIKGREKLGHEADCPVRTIHVYKLIRCPEAYSVRMSTAMKPIEAVAAAIAARCRHTSRERLDLGSPKNFAIACDMAVSHERNHSLAPADIDTFSS